MMAGISFDSDFCQSESTSAYTLADREIREVYEANNWNSALATPIIIDLFSKNRTEYFCSIYTVWISIFFLYSSHL